MNRRATEQRLESYFSAAPEPDTEAIDHAVIAAVNASSRSAVRTRQTVTPRLGTLVRSQLRATRGVVWVAQVLVLVAALVLAAEADNQAFAFAAFGAAASLIVGISVAGVATGRDSALTELMYSCHFDCRRVVLVRMIMYGVGDVIAFSLLIGLGASLLPIGFMEIATCTAASFFASGFACLFALAHYRGETALVLCAVVSSILAGLIACAWVFFPTFLHQLSTAFWLLVIIVECAGVVVCSRSIVSRIGSGYDHIRGPVPGE